LIIDVSNPKPGGPRLPMPKKSSALHRGYLAAWEIKSDGRLFLSSVSGRFQMKKAPLHADWVSTVICVPVGEVNETLTKEARFETVRECRLDLRALEGNVTKWLLVKEGTKGARWIVGFDWPLIVAAMEEIGIGSALQPARYEAPVRLADDDFARMAEESADLLRRARAGGEVAAKVVAVDAWKSLRKGWADPLPDLDVYAAVRTFRGHPIR